MRKIWPIRKSQGIQLQQTELSARVQELEQQIVDLKAELQQKEVESKGFEDADLVIASEDLFNLDEDDGTNNNLR